MDFLNTATGALVIKFVAAFAVVLVLIFAAMWIFRFIRGYGLGIGGSGRSRQPRLAVLDYTDVDSRRRLVLVRRDNVEHLILLGGPTDVVVETNIVRGQAAIPNPARDIDPANTGLAQEQPVITVPVEPPRTPIREIARAAAGETQRNPVPPETTEAAPVPRPAAPPRSLFNSFAARREQAPDTAKPDAAVPDELNARLDAALRKPLSVPAEERRPVSPPMPPRPAAPEVKPVAEVAPAPEPVAVPAPAVEPVAETPAPVAITPAPVVAPPAPSIPAPSMAPPAASRMPVFAPPPPPRPRFEAPRPEPMIDPPSITPPSPSTVRGPASPALTASERSVFDSLEEEMASLLGRAPKGP